MTKHIYSKSKLTTKSNNFIKKCLTKFEEMNIHRIVYGMKEFIW